PPHQQRYLQSPQQASHPLAHCSTSPIQLSEGSKPSSYHLPIPMGSDNPGHGPKDPLQQPLPCSGLPLDLPRHTPLLRLLQDHLPQKSGSWTAPDYSSYIPIYIYPSVH